AVSYLRSSQKNRKLCSILPAIKNLSAPSPHQSLLEHLVAKAGRVYVRINKLRRPSQDFLLFITVGLQKRPIHIGKAVLLVGQRNQFLAALQCVGQQPNLL